MCRYRYQYYSRCSHQEFVLYDFCANAPVAASEERDALDARELSASAWAGETLNYLGNNHLDLNREVLLSFITSESFHLYSSSSVGAAFTQLTYATEFLLRNGILPANVTPSRTDDSESQTKGNFNGANEGQSYMSMTFKESPVGQRQKEAGSSSKKTEQPATKLDSASGCNGQSSLRSPVHRGHATSAVNSPRSCTEAHSSESTRQGEGAQFGHEPTEEHHIKDDTYVMPFLEPYHLWKPLLQEPFYRLVWLTASGSTSSAPEDHPCHSAGANGSPPPYFRSLSSTQTQNNEDGTSIRLSPGGSQGLRSLENDTMRYESERHAVTDGRHRVVSEEETEQILTNRLPAAHIEPAELSIVFEEDDLVAGEDRTSPAFNPDQHRDLTFSGTIAGAQPGSLAEAWLRELAETARNGNAVITTEPSEKSPLAVRADCGKEFPTLTGHCTDGDGSRAALPVSQARTWSEAYSITYAQATRKDSGLDVDQRSSNCNTISSSAASCSSDASKSSGLLNVHFEIPQSVVVSSESDWSTTSPTDHSINSARSSDVASPDILLSAATAATSSSLWSAKNAFSSTVPSYKSHDTEREGEPQKSRVNQSSRLVPTSLHNTTDQTYAMAARSSGIANANVKHKENLTVTSSKTVSPSSPTRSSRSNPPLLATARRAAAREQRKQLPTEWTSIGNARSAKVPIPLSSPVSQVGTIRSPTKVKEEGKWQVVNGKHAEKNLATITQTATVKSQRAKTDSQPKKAEWNASTTMSKQTTAAVTKSNVKPSVSSSPNKTTKCVSVSSKSPSSKSPAVKSELLSGNWDSRSTVGMTLHNERLATEQGTAFMPQEKTSHMNTDNHVKRTATIFGDATNSFAPSSGGSTVGKAKIGRSELHIEVPAIPQTDGPSEAPISPSRIPRPMQKLQLSKGPDVSDAKLPRYRYVFHRQHASEKSPGVEESRKVDNRDSKHLVEQSPVTRLSAVLSLGKEHKVVPTTLADVPDVRNSLAANDEKNLVKHDAGTPSSVLNNATHVTSPSLEDDVLCELSSIAAPLQYTQSLPTSLFNRIKDAALQFDSRNSGVLRPGSTQPIVPEIVAREVVRCKNEVLEAKGEEHSPLDPATVFTKAEATGLLEQTETQQPLIEVLIAKKELRSMKEDTRSSCQSPLDPSIVYKGAKVIGGSPPQENSGVLVSDPVMGKSSMTIERQELEKQEHGGRAGPIDKSLGTSKTSTTSAKKSALRATAPAFFPGATPTLRPRIPEAWLRGHGDDSDVPAAAKKTKVLLTEEQKLEKKRLNRERKEALKLARSQSPSKWSSNSSNTISGCSDPAYHSHSTHSRYEGFDTKQPLFYRPGMYNSQPNSRMPSPTRKGVGARPVVLSSEDQLAFEQQKYELQRIGQCFGINLFDSVVRFLTVKEAGWGRAGRFSTRQGFARTSVPLRNSSDRHNTGMSPSLKFVENVSTPNTFINPGNDVGSLSEIPKDTTSHTEGGRKHAGEDEKENAPQARGEYLGYGFVDGYGKYNKRSCGNFQVEVATELIGGLSCHACGPHH
ncbi:hypothetical protein B0A49_01346 [Cryomyces minteri]|uniref:Uncharacterized protein n=1 Tax=Cryomyces minteri TaxID=331657 RepID=A0A4U0XU27_9PEZI|nr:hypothetical protein B0A49_01346 [Cryomyces minteri]